MRQLEATPADQTAEEQAVIEALQAEQAKLEAEYQDADELPEEAEGRLGEIEQALAAVEGRPEIFAPVEIVHAGAFVSIGAEGTLLINRGYVRPEDEPAFAASVTVPRSEPVGEGSDSENGAPPDQVAQRAVIMVGGQPAPDEEEDDGTIKPLPDRLIMELTAHRTLALQDVVATHPHIAMTALLYKLCLDAFHRTYGHGCLEAIVRHVQLSVQAPNLKESTSAKSIADRHEAWKADMPSDEAALWDWLNALDDASRLALLAHCVSFGVNALFEKVDRHGGPGITAHGLNRRLDQAGRLARAVELDMVEAGWRPTVDNYLGRVTKSRIIEAVREAKGDAAAQLIDHLKKLDMAKEAERLLEGAGWLPEPLRRVAGNDSSSNRTDTAVELLPAFLSCGEDDTADGSEADTPPAVAAE
jgi:ParB family chromosome partitioning protein